MNEDLFSRVRAYAVAAGQFALWPLGGAGYVLKTTNTTLLIDPFIGPGSPPEWTRAIPPPFTTGQIGHVDGVFLTHEHDDHADPVALAAISLRTEAYVVGPKSVMPMIRAAAIPRNRMQLLPNNATVVLGDIRITAVPMYDPNAKSCNGYVFQSENTTLLHCGDSLYFPGFVELTKRWSFDAICVSVALNPPGKLYYMDESSAARAARDSKTKMLILQHHDLWAGLTLDTARVVTAASWYCPKVKVVTARVDEQILVSR